MSRPYDFKLRWRILNVSFLIVVLWVGPAYESYKLHTWNNACIFLVVDISMIILQFCLLRCLPMSLELLWTTIAHASRSCVEKGRITQLSWVFLMLHVRYRFLAICAGICLELLLMISVFVLLYKARKMLQSLDGQVKDRPVPPTLKDYEESTYCTKLLASARTVQPSSISYHTAWSHSRESRFSSSRATSFRFCTRLFLVLFVCLFFVRHRVSNPSADFFFPLFDPESSAS